MRRMVKAALGVALLASLVVGASVAFGATPPHSGGGKIQVFITEVNNVKSKVLITGAIGDYGTGLSTTASGKPAANGNFEKITLSQGGFTVDATAFNKALDKAKPQVNQTTCSEFFSGSGSGTIEKGTGGYFTVTGKVKITVSFAAVAPRKANNQCNFSQKVKPKASYQSISATGNVQFHD